MSDEPRGDPAGQAAAEPGRRRWADVALPATIPIFPLSGVVLLPGGRLPLNVFEPRYLNMVQDAVEGDGMIGMIQPRVPEAQLPDDHPAIYGTGCVGALSDVQGTDDGRIVLAVNGLSRFDVVQELPIQRGYRRIEASYAPYGEDRRPDDDAEIDRERLLRALRAFVGLRELDADWRSIEATQSRQLVTALAMILPFAPSEKQALLEARDLAERAGVLVALLEMTLIGGEAQADTAH